ncbi:hypothetical protein GKZ90_0011055 [Flavobacterium sp. MC2016-06]|jgi:hypothetical protein|uniref:hypothetical protein n=1 Tax=Flavobacterium sp. MC2016-06 TaxID=2676308 RepID=UPI0012BA6D25|nr:hypothetical protein [Flavobacterium sp. MC2016-06]MBU3858640.1 hypothetical protein [Flavobacterium sp. MC2016-06]
MDILDFTDKFQKIEAENNFFTEKDSEGILYWDVVRHDVFYLLYYIVCDTKLLPSLNARKSKMALLSTLLNNVLGYINFKLKTSYKYKYICFTTSRNKEADKNVDFILDDILSNIHQDSLVIESFNKNTSENRYKSVFNYGLLMSSYKWRLKYKFSKKMLDRYRIAEILKHEFNVDLTSDIDAIITNYKISKSHYLLLFAKVKPKAIFLVQNGIQKGLFEAAHKLNIRVIELQHGLIGYIHPAYSYPSIIRSGELETLPDTFFSFSDFWTNNLNFPVKNIIPLGNNFYSNRIVNKSKEYDLTFIFANIYSTDLLQFVDNLLKNDYKGKICIKLHPNQLDEFNVITSQYEAYDTIDVIASQRSMGEILSVSKAIFAIQSTAVYEALHYKVKVYLYKIKDYLTHQDVIGNPNVYLVDNVADLDKYDANNFVDSEVSAMFEPFNDLVFNDFIKNL